MRVQPDLQAHKAFKVMPELMALQDLLARILQPLDQLARQDNKELRVLTEAQDQQDLKVFKAFKASKATLARQGRQAHNLRLQVLQERKAILDLQARPEQLARHLRLPDQLVLLERKVCRVMLDPQEHRVELEALDQLARKVFKVIKEFKALPVLQGARVLWELQAQLEQTVRHQQSPARQGRPALKAFKEFKVSKEYRAMLAQLEHRALKEMLEQLVRQARNPQFKAQLVQRVQLVRHLQSQGQPAQREQLVRMVCHHLIINIKQTLIK